MLYRTFRVFFKSNGLKNFLLRIAKSVQSAGGGVDLSDLGKSVLRPF